MSQRRIRYQGRIGLVRELVRLLTAAEGVDRIAWTPAFMRIGDMPNVNVGRNFVITVDGRDDAVSVAIRAFRDRFGPQAADALDGPFNGEPAPA